MGLSDQGVLSCYHCTYYTVPNCNPSLCLIYDSFWITAYCLLSILCVYQLFLVIQKDAKNKRRVVMHALATTYVFCAIIRPFNYLIFEVSTMPYFLFVALVARTGNQSLLAIVQLKLLIWIRILSSSEKLKFDTSLHGYDIVIAAQFIIITIASIAVAIVGNYIPSIYNFADSIIDEILEIVFCLVTLALIYFGAKIYKSVQRLSNPPKDLLKRVRARFYFISIVCGFGVILFIVITVWTIPAWLFKSLVNVISYGIVISVVGFKVSENRTENTSI